jgi:hypothetical protein
MIDHRLSCFILGSIEAEFKGWKLRLPRRDSRHGHRFPLPVGKAVEAVGAANQFRPFARPRPILAPEDVAWRVDEGRGDRFGDGNC